MKHVRCRSRRSLNLCNLFIDGSRTSAKRPRKFSDTRPFSMNDLEMLIDVSELLRADSTLSLQATRGVANKLHRIVCGARGSSNSCIVSSVAGRKVFQNKLHRVVAGREFFEYKLHLVSLQGVKILRTNCIVSLQGARFFEQIASCRCRAQGSSNKSHLFTRKDPVLHENLRRNRGLGEESSNRMDLIANMPCKPRKDAPVRRSIRTV